MLLRVKIIAVLGSLGLLAIVLELVRRRKLKEEYSVLWLGTAVGLLILSASEMLLTAIARLMGIFYPPSALFVIGFGFTLLILLYFSVIVSELSTENKELAQRLAILEWQFGQLARGEDTHAPGTSGQMREINGDHSTA